MPPRHTFLPGSLRSRQDDIALAHYGNVLDWLAPFPFLSHSLTGVFGDRLPNKLKGLLLWEHLETAHNGLTLVFP